MGRNFARADETKAIDALKAESADISKNYANRGHGGPLYEGSQLLLGLTGDGHSLMACLDDPGGKIRVKAPGLASAC